MFTQIFLGQEICLADQQFACTRVLPSKVVTPTLGYQTCVSRWYLSWVLENLLVFCTLPDCSRSRVDCRLSVFLSHRPQPQGRCRFSQPNVARPQRVPHSISDHVRGHYTFRSRSLDGTQQCTFDLLIRLWSTISQVVLNDLPIMEYVRPFFTDRKLRVTPQAVSVQQLSANFTTHRQNFSYIFGKNSD
ncbi:hypothetical protein RvY_12531-1 [Ramazzottius varieornatus]|uniref:Uncharacterized protein n=1 Tax=Ramazzottius varieornatus TaxID=947166 RepID=A0A1D1VJT5_RAMVA|nr:hypothetical protein RvY_12531-1 [Ramazzottius varieornatus]